jgi:hypothetical protein
MNGEEFIRDLIYLDLPKVASLYSQVTGGIVREVQSTVEVGSSNVEALGVRALVVEARSEEGSSRQTARTEALLPHHALVRDTEVSLFKLGIACDVNSAFPQEPTTVEDIHGVLASHPYVRCTGPSYLEDYDRMRLLTEKFPELLEFVARSAAGEELASDPEFARASNELQQAQLGAVAAQGTKREEHAKKRALDAYIVVRSLIQARSGLQPVEDWLLEGIQLWIDTFSPERVSLRFYPFPSLPKFQVIASLNREHFLGPGLDQFRYAYGAEPNLPLTAVGLVTSRPPAEKPGFSAMEAFQESAETGTTEVGDEDEANQAAFDAAFRALFPLMENLERFTRFSRYPAVTMAPLAVYRRLAPGGVAPNAEEAGATASLSRRLWSWLTG